MVKPLITVELFGMPRHLAGRMRVLLRAETVAELLQGVQRMCPKLVGLTAADGTIGKHFLLSINGVRFIADTEQRLREDDQILILSADAGG